MGCSWRSEREVSFRLLPTERIGPYEFPECPSRFGLWLSATLCLLLSATEALFSVRLTALIGTLAVPGSGTARFPFVLETGCLSFPRRTLGQSSHRQMV